jgi:putative heme-binding domain-containing protein
MPGFWRGVVVAGGWLMFLAGGLAQAADRPPLSVSLEQQLLQETPAALAQAARQQGDLNRGAILFYQPYLTCTKCHSLDQQTTPLGPDLTQPGPEVNDVYLVEAVLQPSKALKKGFEPIVVITDEGKSLTGLLAEDRPDVLILRDPVQDGKLISIAKDRIEEQAAGPLSVMPAGLAIGLADRQQFLDLIRYLIEITEKGLQRARQLEPPAHLYALPPIPEYEKDIDHAGLLRELDADAFKRGEAIYGYLCVNCHGTKDQPGSLPTSLRFASGPFKNGYDPYRMYQTLTKGYGMMMPQTWMVPQQKYDVIHYLREAYLKPYNATQYAAVDAEYLAQLPPGAGRGPPPENLEPWITMDYGPHLTATYEVGSDQTNFAYKGIAVRLDPGPGGVSRGSHWMLYDHDTLRVAAAWSGHGFIDWDAILFNGRHAVHPRLMGQVHLANPTGPGWADPVSGSFEDPRLRGRDDRPYGPLPRTWAHYRGLYDFGNQAIVAYTVGDTELLETPGVETTPAGPVFTRTFQIGPRSKDLLLQVAQHPGAAGLPAGRQQGDSIVVGRVAERRNAAADGESRPLDFDGATQVQAAKPEDFDLTRHDYTIAARIKTQAGGSIFCQTLPGTNWVPNGKSLFVRGGRLAFDIGWVGAVTGRTAVDEGNWHRVAMTWEHETGRVRLYVDGQVDGEGNLKPKGDLPGAVLRIGFTATNFPERQSFFLGQLADVRFYQRRLSDQEVLSLQDGGGPDRGLQARWQLAEHRNGAVADTTGHGHDGAVIRGQTAMVPSRLLVAGVEGLQPSPQWVTTGQGPLRLQIQAGNEPLKFRLWFADVESAEEAEQVRAARATEPAVADLEPLTHGGLPRWPTPLETKVTLGDDSGPFAVDVLSHPASNPWLCRTRFTGFDFFPDGRQAAICSWDGDVWLVRGVDRPEQGLVWQRIASGLFQPLGLKIVRDQIYVACRDQIVILRDTNGDRETDFYENFNNDHQVTEHFHEFAMGLQTDAAGNFYYAKGARHALPALVPQHGTLLGVSADGLRTEILANGFRAPNGVCLNPDGTWFVTDQEGHWTPKNRINLITKAGGFFGNFWGYHDVRDPGDDAMRQPVVWITNAMDRSPAELIWVNSDAWGPLKGTLLNTSYGYGMLYTVPHETVDGQMQGGVCPLPLRPFPTGIMRVRFHPQNGQLYACGMFAWAGNQTEPGGFYRIRYTGKPVHLPIGLHARQDGMQIKFSGTLDPQSAGNAANYAVQIWSIRRSANYGSDHYDETPLTVTHAALSADGRTVTLQIPQIKPTWCMEIKYWLKGAGGEPVSGTIHNTIHRLGERQELTSP